MSRPRLFGRLAAAARVIVLSAPPGSGKTVLLRSWISWAGLADRAARVPAGRVAGSAAVLAVGAGHFDQAFSAGSALTQREAVAIARNRPDTATRTS